MTPTRTMLTSILMLMLLTDTCTAYVLDNTFLQCPKGFTSGSQQIGTTLVRSKLECVSECSRLGSCAGTNVCPVPETGQYSCDLLADTNSGSCSGLTVSVSSCLYLEKIGFQALTTISQEQTTVTVPETTELVCENGGTPNGDHCSCTIQYGGRKCERLIRDCSEAFDNGYQNMSLNGAYTIQPVSSPSPFKVRCILAYNGVTYPFVRSSGSPSFNVDWAAAKAGFGDDLNVNPNSDNFFIGLDKLRLLLKQAEYNVHIFMMWDSWSYMGGAYYANFTIGPESTDYALNYLRQYGGGATPMDNGFVATPPVIFSTWDHDPNGCAATKGAAGWYGADCQGYSVFADNFQWPIIAGPVQTVELVIFNLVRTSGYYVDS